MLALLLVTVVTSAWAQEPATTYTVKMKAGTEDATSWQGKAGEGEYQALPLEGVAAGTAVSVKYSGTKLVKSIKAKKVEPVTLATPLTVEALTDGTITVTKAKTDMQYSLNGAAKTSDGIASITVKAGDKVAFYGNGTTITSYDRTQIGGSGDGFQCKVYGNVMSLLDEENFATATELTAASTFNMLFYGNTALTDASSLLLPATTMEEKCYQEMFSGCTALTAAPKLPATTMASNCYSSMFRGCTSLTVAPELPATDLTMANKCYGYMFQNCSGLTEVPNLPATELTSDCYYMMFKGCTGLTALPADLLPATKLFVGCYNSMFSGCTGLTAIPDKFLPATTVAKECYGYMFDGCTGLTAIPADLLPATTMANECYYKMFNGCTGLTAIPDNFLPAKELTESCYYRMFGGCSGLTALPDNLLPASTLAESCYYGMFDGCTGLTALPATLLPATTMVKSCYTYMFRDCSGLPLCLPPCCLPRRWPKAATLTCSTTARV